MPWLQLFVHGIWVVFKGFSEGMFLGVLCFLEIMVESFQFFE